MDPFKIEIPKRFSLPRRISRLAELAYNLWWVWTPDAQHLFSRIDPILWEKCNHNPVAFLSQVERPRLNALVNDRIYLEIYDRVLEAFDSYLKADRTWFKQEFPKLNNRQIAYFSFEFGLHESVPVYAGGLGILAGDHLKEASDLGLPLVGVGFIYNQGYFTQHITEDGWQETGNYHLNFFEMPIYPLYDSEGENPLMISVDLPGRKVWARIWTVQVGRVSLYLLDSNVDENSPTDRDLTARLYSNDLEVRISQEILLGMGGVRALRQLGFQPSVYHMNEGHSAFLVLERLRERVENGEEFSAAVEKVRNSSVFTTHTPVPAGIDQFPLWLIDKYFSALWPQLGLSRDEFIDLGRQVQPWGEGFSMAVLAIKLTHKCNGVSELHGQVSRSMFNFLWPGLKEDDVPITHITNGVHTASWLARRVRLLYDLHLGPDWMEHLDDLDMWAKVVDIPDEQIWAERSHLKRKLVHFVNERAREQWTSGRMRPPQVVASGVMLDPHVLTIGFARRFATYKRGYLVFTDFERLVRLLTNLEMPVQIIFAGKAHPADEPGKLIIQQIYRAIKDPRTAGRLAFVEDYDMNVSRYLVQGVDVWLNTPRRPNEASGTSGMKAAINGALNFSVLDGWWQEGFNDSNGWAIGGDSDVSDPNQQDAADAESLYDTLENEIIPLYYDNRTQSHVPTNWVARVKESIRTLVPQFSMQRMVKEYIRELYLPSIREEKVPSKK